MSKVLNPQYNIFCDSLDLEDLFTNPLATEVNLLLFTKIEAAKEYCSTVKNPVFIPSAPMSLYSRGFLFPWVMGSPPVLSHVN